MHQDLERASVLSRTLLLSAVIAALLAASASAQTPEEVVREIRFEQKLNQPLPLDVAFADESGRRVLLREYFGARPVIIAMVYFECPLLCTQLLNGLTQALKPVSLNPGSDFEVLVISIDPNEGSELAARKKAAYMGAYSRPGTESGWHFLTGDAAAIREVSNAIGYRYVYDPGSRQFAHASGIVVLTPEGTISRYFFGIEYSPRDVRLGLVEASSGKIGNLADQVLLYCYAYNAIEGKYGFAIVTALRTFGLLTVCCVAGFIFVQMRRERRSVRRGGETPQGRTDEEARA